MSINVTVTGNPVCIKKKIVLSDFEQIKKNERERRKRLRLAQVRQQSKDMSSKLLERAKNIAKSELNRYENNKNSPLNCLHTQKIMEIQQKYENDIRDIGLAHNTAASQLEHNSADVDEILDIKKNSNHTVAVERGKIASQRLKESSQINDPIAVQQERLRQVRNVENIRSSMIASLSTNSSPKKKHTDVQNDELISSLNDETSKKLSPKKNASKRSISKKSPVRVISKPTIKVSTTYRKNKVSHSQRKEFDDDDHQVPSTVDNKSPDKKLDGVKTKNPVLLVNLNSEKTTQTTTRYNPGDYRQDTSTDKSINSMTNGSSSSNYEIVVDDRVAEKKKKPTSSVNDEIHMYNHFTGQRNVYKSSTELAERIDMTNEPNANEIARKSCTTELTQSNEFNKKSNQRIKTQSRGQSALLREQVRNDYQNLMENLDHLSREERKLKAASLLSSTKQNKHDKIQSRKKDMQEIKQQKMNRAFDNITDSSRNVPLVERIITIQSSDHEKSSHVNSDTDEQDYTDITRDEQILKMLQRIEKQKKLLLKEYGTDLPDNILSSSTTPLFQNSSTTTNEKQKDITQEIEVIKIINNDKTKIQVEIIKPSDDNKENNNKIDEIETSRKSDTLKYIEPVVTIIRHGDSNSSSSSNDTGPIRKNKNDYADKTEIKSLPTSKAGSPVQKNSSSAPVSRTTSPRKREKVKKLKTVDNKKSNDKHHYVDTNTDMSFNNSAVNQHQQQQQQQQYLNKKMSAPKESIIKNSYTSDTSTSYASLPATRPGASFTNNNDNNITPILQLLDSPMNNNNRRLQNISPVSTPETPSPRTLRIPSNKPNYLRIGRSLRFEDDKKPSKYNIKKKIIVDNKKLQSNNDDDVDGVEKNYRNTCTCDNPTCRYIHHNLNKNIDRPRMNSDPDTLKRYDELQNVCKERIASLNARIKNVRDENQIMDYSLLAPSDDTILMQMPPPRPPRSDLYCVQQLVDSIEVIHTQLAKTLSDSQKIMTGNARKISKNSTTLKSPRIVNNVNVVDEVIDVDDDNDDNDDAGGVKKTKPKVVSDEFVKLDLNRFKPFDSKPNKNPMTQHNQDDIVEKLSKEILEQSKNEKRRIILSPESDSSMNNQEIQKLDICKISSCNKTRPPISNLQFRADMISPPRELSTILEFDTSGTLINRSQVNISSPVKNVQSKKSSSSSNERENNKSTEIEKAMSPKKIHKSNEIKNYLYEQVNKEFRQINSIQKASKSLLINYEKRLKMNEKITSSSSTSFSELSGISEIYSTPTSTETFLATSSEGIEEHLQKCGINWALTTLRKTREAYALSSSSNSDIKTDVSQKLSLMGTTTTNKNKKHTYGLPDFSDVSSISIQEANKSTERGVLMKARTSTPNIQCSNYSSKSSLSISSATTFTSQDKTDSINLVAKR
ncbi:uncharacterized protein DDB_G0287625 [Aphidius gifuensis]|uniref:uncharacterized protein DDB_G0287625 n=1 Tax=Aphidius gifuensis TaxID=684658 RepID=UPI001CDD086F|nr:uncharacterized protein DDB_G0287625 [Aphidius gifuensis]